MRHFKLAVAFALIIGSGACATTPNTAGTSAAPVIEYPHVKRPNLVVSDIERALTIYRDILGLTASEIGTSSPDSYSYPVFNIPDGAQIRGATLHEPGEQRVLALTELATLDLPRPSATPHMSAVVIGVTDLVGKFEQIEALGLKTTEPKIASGADFDFVEQAFIDYDGHLIVLYEVLAE